MSPQTALASSQCQFSSTILAPRQRSCQYGESAETVKRRKRKTVLRLPDLEQSKSAALNSLAAASSRESYGHAIDGFIGWYCSEPRLSFNRKPKLNLAFRILLKLEV